VVVGDSVFVGVGVGVKDNVCVNELLSEDEGDVVGV
jgi:hypothetical protein